MISLCSTSLGRKWEQLTQSRCPYHNTGFPLGFMRANMYTARRPKVASANKKGLIPMLVVYWLGLLRVGTCLVCGSLVGVQALCACIWCALVRKRLCGLCPGSPMSLWSMVYIPSSELPLLLVFLCLFAARCV